MALANDACGTPARPIASRRILNLADAGEAFFIVITPTFDCGRYQSRLKLLEMKVDKFPAIGFVYFI
ncbi:hypothetical protein LJR234_002221 [Mesorhizobium amorphae]|uniref:hypothetical protein n=1 Tax=Mesorhizobium amorphae TaxID=71433 RepID=UPI003ED0387A